MNFNQQRWERKRYIKKIMVCALLFIATMARSNVFAMQSKDVLSADDIEAIENIDDGIVNWFTVDANGNINIASSLTQPGGSFSSVAEWDLVKSDIMEKVNDLPPKAKRAVEAFLEARLAQPDITKQISTNQISTFGIAQKPELPEGVNAGLVNSNGNDCNLSAAFQVLSKIKPFVQALEAKDKNGETTTVQNEFLTFIKNLHERPLVTRSREGRQYNPATNATREFRDFITQPFIKESDNIHIQGLPGLGAKKIEWDVDQNGALRYTLLRDQPADRNPDGSIVGKRLDMSTETGDYSYEQEDAQEFFSGFMNMLMLNRLGKEDTALAKIFEISEQSKVSKDSATWVNSGAAERSPFLFLPVEDENMDPLTDLEGCLQAHAQSEYLPDLEMPGQSSGGFRKSILKGPLPEVLTIIFRRFAKSDGDFEKVSHPITFPTDDLDMTPYLDQNDVDANEKGTYHLFGIVVQTGSLLFGHYRAFTKGPDNKWREYDDETVRELEIGEIDQIANQAKEEGTPYMLFYEKNKQEEPVVVAEQEPTTPRGRAEQIINKLNLLKPELESGGEKNMKLVKEINKLSAKLQKMNEQNTEEIEYNLFVITAQGFYNQAQNAMARQQSSGSEAGLIAALNDRLVAASGAKASIEALEGLAEAYGDEDGSIQELREEYDALRERNATATEYRAFSVKANEKYREMEQ